MEASGVYWEPPWAILEDEFDCMLVNARHVKQGPGRKTDVSDAEWLCAAEVIISEIAADMSGSRLPVTSTRATTKALR